MTRTRPGLAHPTHVSETISNQYPTSPPPGPVNPPASSMIERLPRGLSTRANLLAFVAAAVFSIIAYGFTSIGRYVHFGYWRLVAVAAYCVIGLIAAIACASLAQPTPSLRASTSRIGTGQCGVACNRRPRSTKP